MFWRSPGKKLVENLNFYRKMRSNNKRSLFRKIRTFEAKIKHIFWSLVTGSDISRNALIPNTTKLPHPNGIVIHEDAEIGENCMIMQQVTIGQTATGGAARIGHNVYIGAGAKILGEIKIGNNVSIGANAVVLNDISDNSTAVGVPARIIKRD